MTTVTCQHSGIQFESKSGRAKNHPALDSILKNAYRNGIYSETTSALGTVRADGGYETIEQYLELVNERINAAVAKRREREERRRQAEVAAEQEYQERRRQREARNTVLRQHGFKWIGDWGMDTFDEYEEPSGRGLTDWWLRAPDGEEISVEQAMRIINGETTLEALRT